MFLLKLRNMLAKLNQKFKDSTICKKIKSVLSFCFHYFHKNFLFGLLRPIDEKFLKFLFVGVLNSVFAYIIYALFITIGLEANIALFFQYIIGVLWNFKTTGAIVFKNSDNKLIFKFILSYIFTFVLNSLLLNFLIKFINDYLAQALLIPFIAVVSFLIFKFFVFKK